MNQQIYYIQVILLWCIIFTTACKTLDTNLRVPTEQLPMSYIGSNDSSNIAQINWKEYFTDSFLVGLIEETLENNPDLQMALQRIEVYRSYVRFTKGLLLPQVDAQLAGGVRRFGLYTMDGAGNATTDITPGRIVPKNLPDIYLGFQASWEIDIWNKLKNQRNAALSQYLASIESKNFIITSLIAEVATAYYELIALDNELEVIRQTAQNQQEILDIILVQKEAGRVNELVVQQFNAQLLNTQALEKETLQQITESENKINFLLGRFNQPVERQKESLFEAVPIQIASGIPFQLLENRPDIREAEFQVQASRFDLQVARAAFFPSLNINAGLGFQAFSPEFLFKTPASIAYSFLGNLALPIINRNALKALFNSAKANQLQAIYAYQKAIVNGYLEVLNELANIQNLAQINTLKRQQSEALSQAVEISSELFNTARATYLEVLLAQQNALQTQIELIDASKRQHIATVNIYKALGGGWR